MIEEPFKQGAVLIVVDMVKALSRSARLANVPVECAQRAGVDEALQGAVQPAERATQAFEQRRRGLALGQRPARSHDTRRTA